MSMYIKSNQNFTDNFFKLFRYDMERNAEVLKSNYVNWYCSIKNVNERKKLSSYLQRKTEQLNLHFYFDFPLDNS